MFALILGPIGLGVISQFLNFQSFLTGVICFGIPVGITTIVAQNINKNNFKNIQSLFVTLSIIIGVISGIVSIVLVFWAHSISDYLVNDKSYYSILIIFMILTPFLIQYNLLEAYLKGKGKIDLIVKLNIANAIFSIIIVYPLVHFYSLKGAAILFLLSGIFPIIMYSIIGKFSLKYVFSIKRKLDIPLLKNVLKIGIVSLASSFLFQLSMIQIRKFIIDYYGIESAGLYQSVLGLSTNYFVIIYSFLSLYTLPQLSRIETNHEIIKELNINFRFILFIIIPMAMLMISFKEMFLKIFYSSEFVNASGFFYMQIIGDIFRALAALFGLWLIPKYKIIALISIDAILNILLLGLPYLSVMLQIHSLTIIPVIYLTAFIVHFILYFIYSKVKLNYKFEKKTTITIIIAIIMTVSSVLLNYYNIMYHQIFVIIILLMGSYFVFDNQEKKKLYNDIKLKLNKFS